MTIFKQYITAYLLTCTISAVAVAQIPSVSESTRAQREADALFFDALKAGVLDDDQQEETLLLQLVQKKQDNAAAWYHLARLNIRQAETDKAADYISKAVSLDTANSWYLQLQADIYTYQHHFEKAAVIYQRLSGQGLQQEEFLFKGAVLYERAGKYPEALALLDQLRHHTMHAEKALLQQQKIHLRMNNTEAAVRVTEELIAQDPAESRYYTNLADIYKGSNQHDKAQEIYRQAEKKLKEMIARDPGENRYYLNLADIHADNDQPKKMLEVYQQGLKNIPDEPSLQYGIALSYRQLENQEQYHVYIRKVILNPGFEAEAQISILRAYLDELSLDSIRKQESALLSEQLMMLYPDNAEAIALHGQVLYRTSQPEAAAIAFKKALKIAPDMWAIWQELLFLYTNVTQADSLISSSRQAMRYFPNQSLIHYLNGVGHSFKNNHIDALKSYNRAIDLQPEDNRPLLSDMYASAGDTYHALRENERADSCYEKALLFNPDNATVLNNYSYYLSLRKTRLNDAEQMSRRSLEIRPGEATFLDTYAWILYQQGKYKEAKEYMEKAIAADPDPDGTLWDHLGDIMYKLGDKDTAVTYWEKASKKGTANPLINKKIQERRIYE